MRAAGHGGGTQGKKIPLLTFPSTPLQKLVRFFLTRRVRRAVDYSDGGGRGRRRSGGEDSGPPPLLQGGSSDDSGGGRRPRARPPPPPPPLPQPWFAGGANVFGLGGVLGGNVFGGGGVLDPGGTLAALMAAAAAGGGGGGGGGGIGGLFGNQRGGGATLPEGFFEALLAGGGGPFQMNTDGVAGLMAQIAAAQGGAGGAPRRTRAEVAQARTAPPPPLSLIFFPSVSFSKLTPKPGPPFPRLASGGWRPRRRASRPRRRPRMHCSPARVPRRCLPLPFAASSPRPALGGASPRGRRASRPASGRCPPRPRCSPRSSRRAPPRDGRIEQRRNRGNTR